MYTTHTFPLILPAALSIAAFPGESVSRELSLNMEIYDLIHILLLLLLVLVEIKIAKQNYQLWLLKYSGKAD